MRSVSIGIRIERACAHFAVQPHLPRRVHRSLVGVQQEMSSLSTSHRSRFTTTESASIVDWRRRRKSEKRLLGYGFWRFYLFRSQQRSCSVSDSIRIRTVNSDARLFEPLILIKLVNSGAIYDVFPGPVQIGNL